MAVVKENLLLIGGGGHCRSCIDVIESSGAFNILGILDLPEKKGSKVLHYEVVGDDGDIKAYAKMGCTFFITLGQIKSAKPRRLIFDQLIAIGAKIATIYAPGAYVSRYAKVKKGSVVMQGAVINAGAKIGLNCIINTGSLIEHDVSIGDHCHISTHAVINGDCKIGDEVFVGSAAVLSSQVELKDHVIIGAGSVVLKTICHPGIYAENPAKKLSASVHPAGK